MKRFVGPHIHSFNSTEIIVEILLRCFGQKCLLLNRGAYIHRKTFCCALENHKSLAQWIFPCLQYVGRLSPFVGCYQWCKILMMKSFGKLRFWQGTLYGEVSVASLCVHSRKLIHPPIIFYYYSHEPNSSRALITHQQ